jgi:hypothetical protein
MAGPEDRVAFALERFERAADGRLEVEGVWSNVRGVRFVRPALVVHEDGTERTLLAILDDKPWDPEARPWRAAFPWDGGDIDPRSAELAVAPSIVVPLKAADGARRGRVDKLAQLRRRLEERDEQVRRLEAEVDFLRRERAELSERADGEGEAREALARAERERDAGLARAERERDAALAELRRREERLSSAELERARVEHALQEAERERAHLVRRLDAAAAAQAAAERARDAALARPAGVVARTAGDERRHERTSSRADWAARVAAILAVLVLLVLFISFLKAV